MTSFAGSVVLEIDAVVVGLGKIFVVAGVPSGEDDDDWQMEFVSLMSFALMIRLYYFSCVDCDAGLQFPLYFDFVSKAQITEENQMSFAFAFWI